MALNKSQQDIMEDRRREVALLRRRRLTMRQIVRALETSGRVNPATGKAWDVATIKRDLDAIRAENKAEAIKEVSEHKTEILADYHELVRLAWQEKRYEDVRKVLKDMRELLGTDAPQVIIYEQMTQRMEEALNRLEVMFRNEPDTLERAYAALMGVADNPATTDGARLSN